MAYDLLIKNGRIIDGSGAHAFRGDVGVRDGKIAEIGKLGGDAARTVDAGGLVVSPGFIDNHCHYDAQIFWDPLLSSSCYHGSTSVIVGNCSLGLAPVRPADREDVAGMLSFVEAIPMDVLEAGVPWSWTSFPEYVAAVGQRLGLNVGILLGHSAVRYFAMGEDSFEEGRAATPAQLAILRAQIREAMEAGALGVSMTRERAHFDLKGRRVPGACAPDDELFEVAGVLEQFGAGVIQVGGGTPAQMGQRLMSRLSDASGRRVLYNAMLQSARTPGQWREHLAIAADSIQAGSRAIPMCTPNPIKSRFTMRNCQIFRGMPNWHPILIAPDEAKLAAYRDPEVRKRLHADLDAPPGPNPVFSRRWDLITIVEPRAPDAQHLVGKTLLEVGTAQGKHPLDVLLDLAVAENLETAFEMCEINFEREAMAAILTSPYTIMGLSDGGAHVQFDSSACYTTRLLGYWVREQKLMPLEAAVRALTLTPALAFEIYDRGLLRPGMAADITIFDPDTIAPLPTEIAHDLPNQGWRIRQRARGVEYTFVNGVMVMDRGEPSGNLPGRVLRNYRTA